MLFRIPSIDDYRDLGDMERLATIKSLLEKSGMEVFVTSSDDPIELLTIIDEMKPELAYSSSARFPDNGPFVHSIFEERNIAYVGSRANTLDLCLNKADLKAQWLRDGINTPSWSIACLTGKGGYELSHALPDFPVLLKPLAGGNSIGISSDSVVIDQASFDQGIAHYLTKHGDCLIERYLGLFRDRREFTVSLIGDPLYGILMPIEIRLAGHRDFPLVSSEDKDGHRTIIATLPNDELSKRIIEFASDAFISSGVRDYSRIDIILAGGEIHAIEINGQPMIPDRWFRECAASQGLEDHYIPAIFLAALLRTAASRNTDVQIPDTLFSGIPEAALRRLAATAAGSPVRAEVGYATR
ncbi:MAG: hypothetical protein ACOYM2_15190 [Rectinemataceae bacterium]